MSASGIFGIGNDLLYGNDTQRLKRACQEFEAIFLQQLLSAMRKGIPKSNLLPHTLARDVYESMLDMAIARAIAKGGGVGLGKMLFEQLKHAPSDLPKGDNSLCR